MGRVSLLVGLVSVGVCVWGAGTKNTVIPVQQCQGQNFEDLGKRVYVNHCTKTKCKLRKGFNTIVTIHFRPAEKVPEVFNNVYANIVGIDLPFLGIHGRSACDKITKADSGEPASCPLAPDVDYVYNNTFPIEQFYPNTDLQVHWSITDGKKDLVCFEIPAVIK